MMSSQFSFRLVVDKDESNVRLDKFISMKCNISRNKAQRLISIGNVALSNCIVHHKDYLVKIGEVYDLLLSEKREIYVKPADICLNVVYEDDDIIVVNKPANMLVHPGLGNQENTLLNAVLNHCLKVVKRADYMFKPSVVHRIDKDTTGLVIVAKNDIACQCFAKLFAERKIRKEYLAVVWGIPSPSHGVIENNIDVNRKNRELMTVVRRGGKHSVTEYNVLQSFDIASLLQCILHTGRTHQLRVHMSHIGHSIVGDQKYGKNSSKILRYAHNSNILHDFKRQALHSYRLEFTHPIIQKNIEFIADVHDDMKNIVNEFIRIKSN